MTANLQGDLSILTVYSAEGEGLFLLGVIKGLGSIQKVYGI